MKTVFFSFQQAGGANALYPLIRQLFELEFKIVIVGREPACHVLRKRGIACKCYSDLCSDQRSLLDELKKFFLKIKPDLLITDTIDLLRTEDGYVCRYLWQWAKESDTFSIAYMDCWWGYDKRFLIADEKRPSVMPGTIATIDRMAKSDMVASGYDQNKIVVLGNPWFEHLKTFNADQSDIRELKQELNLRPDSFLILFISQPIEKTFKGNQKYGFTEKNTLSALIDALNRFPRNIRKKITLVSLLHPEENDTILQSVILKKRADFDIFIKKKDQHKLIKASNLVTGMFSMLLAEAVILNRPVISIQLNLKREEILVTNKIGATKSVITIKDLQSNLHSAVNSELFRNNILKQQQKFKIVGNPLTRWKHYIDSLLNQLHLIK